MDYEKQLLIEIVSVGAMTAAVGRTLQTALPRASPLAVLLLTGAVIHMGCEVSGLNEWYLTHGAAAIKKNEKELEWTITKSPQPSSSYSGFSGGFIVSL